MSAKAAGASNAHLDPGLPAWGSQFVFCGTIPILCDADGIAAMHAKFEAFKFTTWQGPPVGLKHAKLGSVCGCFGLQKQNLKKQKKIPLGNVCAAMVSNFHWCSSKHA